MGKQVDMTEADRFYRAQLGFTLTRIAGGTKGPNYRDWNSPAAWIDSPERIEAHWSPHPTDGVGVVLAPSGIVSLDVDHLEWAELALSAVGIELTPWLSAGVGIIGSPGRIRVLYRAPEGVDLSPRVLSWPQPVEDGGSTPRPAVVFELRAGRLQDVLPPTVHPNTGERYRYSGRFPRSRDEIGELPGDLLEFWLDWEARQPSLAAACPWDSTSGPLSLPDLEPPGASPWTDLRAEIMGRLDLRELAEQAGAVFKGPDRALCPFHEEKNPSFWVFRGDDGADRWCCAHGSADVGRESTEGRTVGDALDLYAHVQGKTVGEATAALAQEMGLELPGNHDVQTWPNGEPGEGASSSGGPDGEEADPKDEGDANARELPRFPLEALPPTLSAFAAEIANSVQVPPELPGLGALAVCAAAVAGKCRIQIGQSFTVPLNLYWVVAMEPGERKSPVFAMVTEPFAELERERLAKAAPEIAKAKQDAASQNERRQWLMRKLAQDLKPDARLQLEGELDQLSRHLVEVPSEPCLITADCTPEKLAALMSDNDERMALFDSEGGIFDTLTGRRYSSNPNGNLDLLLKGHDGDRFVSHRNNRPVIRLTRPLLTLFVTVQPEVLRELGANKANRGRGLLGRFLFSIPRSLVGGRLYQNQALSLEAREAYSSCIRTLDEMEPPEGGAELRLDTDALECWRAFHDRVEEDQAPKQGLAVARDWASKLAGRVARIAGVLHLIENRRSSAPWSLPVRLHTMGAAIEIGNYLIPHALMAFSMTAGADPEMLKSRVLDWIRRNRADRSFRAREVKRAFPATTGQTVTAALTALERQKLIERVAPPPGHRGRPPGPEWRLPSIPNDKIDTSRRGAFFITSNGKSRCLDIGRRRFVSSTARVNRQRRANVNREDPDAGLPVLRSQNPSLRCLAIVE